MKFIDHAKITEGRRNRSADRKIRSDKGLRQVGFIYIRNDFRAEPISLFSDKDGQQYVRSKTGEYKQLIQRPIESLSDQDFKTLAQEFGVST